MHINLDDATAVARCTRLLARIQMALPTSGFAPNGDAPSSGLRLKKLAGLTLCPCSPAIRKTITRHDGVNQQEPHQGAPLRTTNKNGTQRRRKSLIDMVGDAGFEPATPAV